MSTPIPPRLAWAVELLDVQPGDRILEIGGGYGAAAGLVCQRLDTGHYVGIDRSAKMTQVAAQRNDEHVAAGRAAFHTIDLADAGELGETFGKAFAVNVNVFWVRSPARELAAIRRLLMPGGHFFLCYEPPDPARAGELAETLPAAFEANGFTAAPIRHQNLVCLKAA